MQAEGIEVSVTVVDQLLEKHHYRKRKAQKRLTTGSHPQRNEQFENIERLTTANPSHRQSGVEYGHKKRELIGQLYREGRVYTQDEPIEVFDHDWKSLAAGVAIPHGLYDLSLNIGYVHLGTSHDTSQFACDAIRPCGHNMVYLTIGRQVRFYCCVMVEGVIVHVNICSNKICKH